jgi:anaerobic magnesium-protoporphyrin IX monomethyl ester cyclase
MNIVLGTSPAVGDRHGVRSLPPLSIGYIAASVRDLSDVTVKVVDAYGEGLGAEEAMERVLALSPDVLALSTTNCCFSDGLELLKSLKKVKPHLVTVMGGYHPTAYDHLLLKEAPEVDFCVRGEGDHSFRELCERLLQAKPVDGVTGVSYRSNGEVVRGVPCQIEDLDGLPFPDRAVLDYDSYYQQFGGFVLPDILPTANVVSSRGCPHNCTFCSKLMPGWKYRMRSAENILAEILELRSQGVKWVFFQDENFSHDIPRLEKLCGLILENNLDMRFMFQGTIHHLSDSTFQLMHRAGFDFLLVGIESGSDAQLKRFKKPANSKLLGAAVRRAKKAHMVVFGFFVHGGPGETDEDFRDTIRFIREVRPHGCGGEGIWLHSGSPLWEQLVGKSATDTLNATEPKALCQLPGQTDKESVERRIKEFQRALAKSWMHWTRLFELIDLFIHNAAFRYAVLRLIWNLHFWAQLAKGGPK